MSGGMQEIKIDRSAQLGGSPAHKAILRIPVDVRLPSTDTKLIRLTLK
jgi:hypothetical protein